VKVSHALLSLLVVLPIIANAEDLQLCKDGWQQTQSGNHKKAIELFKEGIATGDLSESSLSRTYRNLGIACKRDGQYKASIEYYGKAIAINKHDPWVDYVNRGNTSSELGEFDQALNDYNKAQEIKPDYNEAYYNRGILFEKQNKTEEAKEQFIKAYENGLRTDLLYNRFIKYGLAEKEASVGQEVEGIILSNGKKLPVIKRTQIPYSSSFKEAGGRTYILWIAPDGAIAFHIEPELMEQELSPLTHVWMIQAENKLKLPEGFESKSLDSKYKIPGVKSMKGKNRVDWGGDTDYTIYLKVSDLTGRYGFKGYLYGSSANKKI